MKHPFLSLFSLVFYCACACACAFIFIIWLVSKQPISFPQIIKYGTQGLIIGAFGGCGIWLMYRFNLHK